MPDPISLIPLHLETFYDNKEDGTTHTKIKVSDATGFVFRKGFDNFLITNWHVVTGRNPSTGRPLSRRAAIPNIIRVMFHSHLNGVWLGQNLELLDWVTGEKMWLEHPRGREIDVVALPLKDTLIKTYPLEDVLFDTSLEVLPSEPVSIVGFPFGFPSAGSYPIWKTGHVASDIDENYDGKPVFLVDATVRPGMSGSPVIARMKKMADDSNNGFLVLEGADKFLGVFSGGISKKHKTEIGMVWKPEVVNEIIQSKDELMSKIARYTKHNMEPSP